MGFRSPSPWNHEAGSPSGYPVYVMTRAEVEASKSHILRRLPVPPGMTVQFPYLVKIEGEGEYWVSGDGTATYYDYRAGRWEPPQLIDPLS
jgi:hypothetical protein